MDLNQSGMLYSMLHKEGTIALSFLHLSAKKYNQSINQLNLRSFDVCMLHLLNYFKEQEQMCLYFDAQDPKLTYKIEATPQGHFRSLLLSSKTQKIQSLTGNSRLLKLVPGAKAPSQSLSLIHI